MKILRHPTSEIPSDEIEPLIAGSFFSSPGFLNLWQTLKGLPVWWVARESGRIVAVLPGVEFGRGVLKRFQSTPNGCYGRLSFAEEVDATRRGEIARQFLDSIAGAGYLKVHINDFYGSFEGAEGYREEQLTTRVVNVLAPDFKPPDKKLRQDIRRATELGVSVIRFDHKRHFGHFQTLVKLSERRLGIGEKYPAEFYRKLAVLSDEDDRVQWAWCEHEGRAVASAIFVVEADSLLYWHLHFDPTQAHLNATKLIPLVMARKLVAAGVRYLNLGVTPPGAAGVLQFKHKWGGQEYSYSGLWRKSWLGRLI